MMWMAALILAHSFYDPECCAGQDCAEIPDSAVIEAPDGYHVRQRLVPYADPRIKLSPDEHYHLCLPTYRDAKVRCLYVPRRDT